MKVFVLAVYHMIRFLNKFKNLSLSFVVVSKENELLNSLYDNNVYETYLQSSVTSYLKFKRNEKLIIKLKKIIDNYDDSYDTINLFLDQIIDSYEKK